MKKGYKLLLTIIVLFVFCSGFVFSQDLKMRNYTPVQLTDATHYQYTPINGDNIMTFVVQDFENSIFPPAGWTLGGTANWIRSTDCSGYGLGTASAVADFYSISAGGTLDLVSFAFTATGALDSLKFDHAYATYATEVDQLVVYSSTNGGTTWTTLVTLAGGVSGPLVTAPPTTSTFVPTASQWATKKYALPIGTNKVKFTGISAYGNECYLDNIQVGSPYPNDIAAASIDAPVSNLVPGTYAPKVTVKNWGTLPQTAIPVTVTISPGGYTNTQTVASLASGSTSQLTFANWTPAIGSYTLKAISQLGTDQNRSNDTLTLFIIVSNINRNVLLEYCTGTWCQWCPCGASTAHTLETTYPNMVVLAYHGPAGTTSDPWSTYNGNGILTSLGFGGYPTGIADRTNAPGDYTTFTGFVNGRYNNYAPTPISINVVTKNYNAATGILNVAVNVTSNCNLPDSYRISYVLMENNLVYNQTGNSTCAGSTTFIHNHVVRTLVNGANGDALNNTAWVAGTTLNKSFSTTVNSAWVAANCQLVIFVYKGTVATNAAEVQNVIKTDLTTTGINGAKEVPANFELTQNYPNPFNPTTNIKFSLPKAGNTSLKIYDLSGKEVMTMFSGYMEAGYYNADLDASKLSSGIYFYTLSSGDYKETRKMVLVK